MDSGEQNSNNPTPERQALFTPQPEVPTDATGAPVAPATPAAPTHVNLAHPYLSNHPTQTFNADAGDIVVGDGAATKPKFNKKPLIIGAIALAVVVAICAVVLAVVAGNSDAPSSKPKHKTVSSAYNAYVDYIEFGQEERNNNENKWFIEQLAEPEYSDAERSAEMTKIRELFIDYETVLSQSSEATNEKILYLTNTESNLLDFVAVYLNFENVIQEAINTYNNGNQVQAYALLEDVIPDAPEDNAFRTTFREALVEYAKSSLAIYAFYNDNYCIVDGFVDTSCVAELEYDENYVALTQDNQRLATPLTVYYKRAVAELKSSANNLKEQLNV